ncbi:cytochrome P450 [Xylariomycetidae sp. FL2044]|nr:cytochrome P450 [Xylariomycetidae sp. FL2044]
MMLLLTAGSLVCAFVVIRVWLSLYPKPYPGIPYNKESANRVTGDIPALVPSIKDMNEFSSAVFSITTQKLGTPIAQLLFPGIRKPLVILEDPREIEDLLVRRNKEFDKAPMALDLVAPMFPRSSIAQYTTPELRIQKRIWVDVMGADFLRKTTAPNIVKATLELVDLWRLKASTIYKEKCLMVHDDLKNAALDAIWISIVGEEAGVTRFETQKLNAKFNGQENIEELTPPRGMFLKEEVAYIGETISRNSNTPSPKWAQKLETYTPRYRKFRRTVTSEIGKAMKKAVQRFQSLEAGSLDEDNDAIDTCMMDQVLRRQIVEARKAGKPPTDPTQDQNMIEEMFVMLVGGHDSTANTLTWFVRYMEAYPTVQKELRAVLNAAFPDPAHLTADDILNTEIPYLDGVCEESFSLAGTAKGNLRQAIVDTEILGCRIPKGTEIFMNYHIDRAPVAIEESRRTSSSQATAAKRGDGFQGNPGRDLGSFEPRRWLAKDEKTGKENFNAYALPQLAFGGGYRGCAGRKLATMEFRIIVVLLVLNFEFLELPEEYKSMKAKEKIFREPQMPYAKLRVLR